LVLALLVAGVSESSAQDGGVVALPAPPAGAVRVVTYNIAALSLDRAAVVETLKRLNADVVALQEVDRNTARSGNVDQAQWLATQLGMFHVFAPTIPLEGGEYGLAVLSRKPVTLVKAHRLPRLGKEEPRVALEVRTTAGDAPLTVVNTHLAANWRAVKPDDIRRAQALVLARVLGKTKGTVLVLGDFNTSREVLQPLLGKVWTPAGDALPSYPAATPTLALDQVWTRPKDGWTVLRVAAAPLPGSDHLPVVVDLAPAPAR